MSNRSSYVLHFKTDQGKTETLTINNADPLVSPAMIFSSMDSIVEANAIQSDKGNLVEREKAVLVQRTSTEIS